MLLSFVLVWQSVFTAPGEAGREIEGPMAIVIPGGLVTSTLLNLRVLPTLVLRYGRFKGHKGHDMPS